MRDPRDERTEAIPAVNTWSDGSRQPARDTRQPHSQPTPVQERDEADTVVLPTISEEMAGESRALASTESTSVGKATGSMAVAGLVSKVTGFVRTVVIVWVLGLTATADAYNAANSMPNQVYELLVGGVLTSVMVPLLVRALKDDKDCGEAYIQRLATMVITVLLAVTVLAMICAPLLTDLLVDNSTGRANPALTTAFAYLLLPQIVFYGLAALFSAILNARNVFGLPAWAPVLNNFILIATFAVYPLLPGTLTLNPVRMDDLHILVLGIGSTLGVVVQAAVLIPSLLRRGFRLRWRWGWDPRFSEFGGLALWTVGYALLAQIGVLAVTNVTTAHGGLTIYNSVWLLVQLPYGVVGFALITAILPRMSRAAADDDVDRVKSDLSLANRLSTVVMLPMSVLMTALGPSLGIALFSVGKGAANANELGIALATAAFGVLPYAVTLIQMRVFYALKDARTPTLIMLVMIAVKVSLTYAAPVLLASEYVIYATTFANSLSFVVGWVIGELLLRKRLGPLYGRMPQTLGKAFVAAAAAAAIALLVRWFSPYGAGGAWVSLTLGGIGGMVVAFTVLSKLKVPEMQALTHRIAAIVNRS